MLQVVLTECNLFVCNFELVIYIYMQASKLFACIKTLWKMFSVSFL